MMSHRTLTLTQSRLALTLLVAVLGAAIGNPVTQSNLGVIQVELEDQSVTITNEDDRTKYEEGRAVSWKCTTSASNDTTLVEWLAPSGDLILPGDNDTRVRATAGLLTIAAARLNDTGGYVCRDAARPALNASADLVVFIMPDYFLAGMVVFGINVVLVCLFFACLCYKTVQHRRMGKKYNKMQKPDIEISAAAGEPQVNSTDPSKANFKPRNKHLEL